ncbi:MAG TPA: hypothetical protein VI636_21310 [Candidatus Angelobacter sp.]
MNEQPSQSPQQPDSEVVDELFERLDSIEERLGQMEEAQRLRDIEERLSGLEDNPSAQLGEFNSATPPSEGEGQKALRLAMAALLNNENVVRGFSELPKTLIDGIKDLLGRKNKEAQFQKQVSLRTYYLGLGFSAFVFLVLSTLLWFDKINKELAAGLIGSLIGYWYNRDKGRT